jgi:hypothetical protein
VDYVKMKKGKWLGFLIILLLGAFSTGITAFADDDDDDDKKERYRSTYEKNEDYDDDDDGQGDYYDDEEEGYGEGSYSNPVYTQKGYWNFWIREATSTQDSELPITTPGDVKVKTNGVDGSIHVIPQDGQLLISGEQLANLIDAKSTFYSKSRILIITKDNSELIVRAGSNAAYENKNKTPMPIQAQFIEKSLYIPISVAANSMGYRISWDEAQQALIMENL